MNELIIKFILLFSGIWQRLGVDTAQLQIILSVKLKMDDRRPNVYMTGNRQSKKESKNSSWITLLVMFVMGLFMAAILGLAGNAMMGHTVFFTMFMVMIAITLISDFTSVLIDVRDNFIILPRPVNDITFTVSRILHISVHITKLVSGLVLPALLYLVVFKGIVAGAAFIIETISATVLSIFLVNMVYLVVLKITSAERFKSMISYFQIAFSVIIFAAYQFFPQLINSDLMKSFDILTYKISYFLPPVWFASFYDILVHPPSFSILKLVLAFLGIVMPFVSLIVVIKVLAPGFNRKLSGISGSEQEPSETNLPVKNVSQTPTLSRRLSLLFTRDAVENAGFRLTWLLTSRYRDFKIKVYPSFAYVPVYFVYFGIIKEKGELPEKLENFKNGSGYFVLIYLTSFVLLTVLGQITQSEKYKAAWVMFSTPHNKPGKILSGMFKAVVVKYFVPFYLIIAGFSLFFWGPKVINDIVLGFFNILIYSLILALFTVRHLPFSQPVNPEKQGGKVFINLFLTSIIGLFGYLHYFLGRWEYVVTGLAVISGISAGIIFNYFQKRDWKAIEEDYG